MENIDNRVKDVPLKLSMENFNDLDRLPPETINKRNEKKNTKINTDWKIEIEKKTDRERENGTAVRFISDTKRSHSHHHQFCVHRFSDSD